MSEPIIIEGTVESVVYQNEENGYTVFTVAEDGDDMAEITCVGYLGLLRPGERLRVTGSYVVNARYGPQLSAQNCERMMPNTLQTIERYLGSGVIKGVGERMSKKIVNLFGKETFDIMENTPERLAEIRGISMERAMTIGAAFMETQSQRLIMMFLLEYGIAPSFALRIHKRFGAAAIDVVKTNPYTLSEEIYGVGFKTADDIASKIGISPESPFRARAGVRHVLSEAVGSGHVYLPRSLLLEETTLLLGINPEIIEEAVSGMQYDGVVTAAKLSENDHAVYLTTYYNAEKSVAKKLLMLCAMVLDKRAKIAEEIRAAEEESGIVLAEEQKKAVGEALSNGVLVITGGPGTGKTTTINTIINIMLKDGLKVELAAPTGRAAKRMSEATGMEAKTIHRLLEITFLSEDSSRQTFARNEDNPIEANALIVDESSMVDIMLMNSLLKAVAPGTRLILVGDVDQLPSVGPGNVLKDIINSGRVNVVRLTEIFRQAQESAIIMNAHRINRGEYPVLNEKDKDFFFIKRTAREDVETTIVDLITRRLPGYVDCDALTDIQVLTPMRKTSLGVAGLNKLLQESLNPPSPAKNEREFRASVFREGDKVMQMKNNYNLMWRVFDNRGRVADEGLGVYNGDGGVIRAIDDSSETVTVVFDDSKVVDYEFSQLEELELAYAITIHKSQGSEYKVVVIPIHSGPRMLLSKNLLYTAVTRAKKLAVIVGIPETLFQMVDNDKEINRYTSLKNRLETAWELFDQPLGGVKL